MSFRLRWRWACAGVVLAVAASILSPMKAAMPKDGFTTTVVASGLSNPTAMAFAPDGRIFVAQQNGVLRVIKDGALLPAPFLTLTVNSAGERGLLGVAFDPQFVSNSFVYVYYTATTPTIHNRVSRFTAAGDVAAPGSEVPILDLPTLSATNHNGGALHFGPDGYLYIGVGENAVPSNAQSLNSPLGKILRIVSDGNIPPTNPFLSQTSGINLTIWALGLRNPFTFAFDPSSGRLFINDVGQNTWEEINEGAPAANYGWPLSEGPTTNPAHVSPRFAYTHASTGGCAITGGAFYPVLPTQFPAEYAGDYFYADLCAGWIRRFDLTTGPVAGDFVSDIEAPVDIDIGADGALYYLARGSGSNAGTVERVDFLGAGVRTRRPSSRGVRTGRTAVPRESFGGRAGTDTSRTAGDAAPGRTAESSGAEVGREDVAPMQPSAAGGPTPVFQAAHVVASASSESAIDLSPRADGRIRVAGVTLRQLIQLASGLPLSSASGSDAVSNKLPGVMRDGHHVPPLRIEGGPDWIDSQRFDLEVYAGTGRGPDDAREVLRAVLQERFGLAARFTRQPIDVLALMRAELPARRDGAPPVRDNDASDVSHILSGPLAMARLADELTRIAGRTVLDRTGIGGDSVHVEFRWPNQAAAQGAANYLDLASALERQLGLTLRQMRVEADVLTVDRVERPRAMAESEGGVPR